MIWVVTAQPQSEPVSVAEAQAHLRVDAADDVAHISALITVARQHIERVCERALITQTWRLSLASFPAGGICLPGGLVTEVTSVAYTDANGADTPLSGSAYQTDLDSQPARLVPAVGTSWPATQGDKLNAVRVTYKVGYATASAVPAPIKAALLLIVGELYELREGTVIGASIEDNPAVRRLLMPYKRIVP